MKNLLKNGEIIACGKLFEQVNYDVSNNVFGARFNGNGAIDYYAIADGSKFETPISYMNIVYNGKVQNVLLDKKVSMLGRKQTIEIDLKTAQLKIEQFLSEKDNGIYTSYRLITDNKDDVLEIGVTGNFFYDINSIENKSLKGENKAFISDSDFYYIEENHAAYFRLDSHKNKIRTLMICGYIYENTVNFLIDFDGVCDSVEKEISGAYVPENLNEIEKAAYNSAYWCALENYKEKYDYKGFMAGCRYLSPMRTYYRDSYYTVLPMYNGNLSKVKNQIVTLVRGISPNGACPSAVKSDWSDWWGDHYDSPSFLAMMLYDYIRFSKDISFADMVAGDNTILETSVKAIKHLSMYCDDTGLLYKAGQYNQRDWADEVNRYGYVTYDEILFARALYSIAQIYKLKNNEEQFVYYMDWFKKVKDAINNILWSEELGYYVNFTNEDYTEDNLSIDTVFAAIFDIADEEHSRKMLFKMEQMLETQNNGVDINFGSMCVYPFYKKIDAAKNKSTQSFNYHNGANWPYLSAMYAYAKRKYGMEYKHLLTIPFEYNLKNGNYTMIEYFSPYCKDGSLLQGWSGAIAFVLDEKTSAGFWNEQV